MAKWIKVSGAIEEVAPKGKTFTLSEMQSYVGGDIEALPLSHGGVMWLNERGKLTGLPFNREANRIAHFRTRIADWDIIVGDVLIATPAETGDDEPEADGE